jgi:DNA-directed RNA polymerase specialized sigma24 family protein
MWKYHRTNTGPGIRQTSALVSDGRRYTRPVEDWSREVERRIPEKERGRVVGGFTAALPEKYLVVVALHDVHGFSYEETAQVLNLTIAEVKSRCCRAKLYMRERLTRYLRDARMA